MAKHRFLILLALLLLLLLIHPIAMENGPAHLVLRVLINTVLGVTMWFIFSTRRARIIGLALGLPVIAAHWANETIPAFTHSAVPLVFNLLSFLFLSYTVVMILRSVYLESHLTREAIYGALCGFLLIGASFGHLFYCVDWFAPQDFQTEPGASLALSNDRYKQAVFMYFSYGALTGMSDPEITPRASAARSLVLVEAVLGQFYALVVISELISLRISRVAPPEAIAGQPIAHSGEPV